MIYGTRQTRMPSKMAKSAVAVLLAGTICGSAFAESGSKTFYSGNSEVGAIILAFGEGGNRFEDSLDGRVRLFGRTYSGAAIEATSRFRDEAVVNELEFSVGGSTVFFYSSEGVLTGGWEWDLGVIDKEKTIIVYGVPINVGVSYGTYSYINVVAGGEEPSITGQFGVRLRGTAFAGVDLGLFRVGLSADIRVMDTRLEASNNASGCVSIDFVQDSLRILLSVVLDMAYTGWCGSGWRRYPCRKWKRVGSYTFVDWTASSIDENLLEFGC